MMRSTACLLLLIGFWLMPNAARAQACTYSTNGPLDFGTITGVPTPQIDVTATINVQCTTLLAVVRTCISIPNGDESGGARLLKLATGENVRFQLYKDAARTQPWGAFGEANSPMTLDIPVFLIGRGSATVYGRVFSNQDDKPVGDYVKLVAPIQGRDRLGTGTPCESIGGTPEAAPALSATLRINPMCTVSADPLNFGSFTNLSINRDASSNLRLKCTLGAPYQIALNGGTSTGTIANRRMAQPGNSSTIAYQLYSDASRSRVWGNTAAGWVTGVGTGASQAFVIFGRVPPQPMPGVAGTFEDTVTVTVSY